MVSRALAAHRSVQPRRGLFVRQKKLADWQKKLKELEACLAAAKRLVVQLKQQLQNEAECRSREARQTARVAHPQAALVIDAHIKRSKDSISTEKHHQSPVTRVRHKDDTGHQIDRS